MLLQPNNRGGPGPTRLDYLRRRTVAGAAAAALLVALISLVLGDRNPSLEPAAMRLSPTQLARLPWRAVVTDGSAGVLDSRGLPGPAAQQAAIDRYRAIGLPIYCAGGRGRYAALTFDDGPSPFSGEVLALLRRAHAQSTFFLIGRQVPGNGAIVRRQLSMGAVGDHTWSHPFLTRLSTRDVTFEIGQSKRTLERTLHRPVSLFRSPYEAHNPSVDAVVRRMRLLQILWDVDSRDSAGVGADGIVQNVEAGLRPGAIILMHETYDRSVAALPQVLAAAARKRLRLVSVPQLLALDPPPESQVRAGGVACGERERFQRDERATDMRLGPPPRG